MADDPTRFGLSAELQRLAIARATRNERVLALGRLVVFGTAASVDTISYLRPGALVQTVVDWTFPAVTVAVAALALAALGTVRHLGYRPWMAVAMPLLDTAGMLIGVTNARRVLGPELFEALGSETVIAAGCTLLALTGTLRAGKWAVVGSTSAAVLGLAILLGPFLPLPSALILLGLMTGIALIALELARGQRQALLAEAAQATLGRFLPEEVVRRAWHAPLELLGPPREEQVAILVTDLRGFTAWAESRSPEEVMALLDRVQGRLAQTVRAHHGVVDKFMGDGMLAVFTGPRAADHAMSTAAAIVGAPAAAMAVGVGVHAGPAVLGVLGSGDRLEFTVLGDTVNTASRLEGLTKVHGVPGLISDDAVQRCTAPLPALVDLGTIEVRGRSAGLKVWGLSS